MKKVSIIILLTVLLLSAFTACNGDVFSELMPEPEPEPKRVITLEIPSTLEYVSFDNTEDVKTKELEIPKDCETWADYLTKVTDVKVYSIYGTETYTLMVKDEKVYFCFKYTNSDYLVAFGLELNDSKGDPLPSVNASADIVIGGTYTLTAGSPV